MKSLLGLLFVLCLLLPLAACSSPGGIVEGALTAAVGTVMPKVTAAVATLMPEGTAVPPTETRVPATPIPVDVVITAVVNGNYAEHVVIQNQDTFAADLTGWHLVEVDGEVLPFAFPDGFTLAPGAEVRIYSGRDGRQNNPPESLEWTEKNVWDNNGETATLLNSIDEPVSTFKYPQPTP